MVYFTWLVLVCRPDSLIQESHTSLSLHHRNIAVTQTAFPGPRTVTLCSKSIRLLFYI